MLTPVLNNAFIPAKKPRSYGVSNLYLRIAPTSNQTIIVNIHAKTFRRFTRFCITSSMYTRLICSLPVLIRLYLIVHEEAGVPYVQAKFFSPLLFHLHNNF